MIDRQALHLVQWQQSFEQKRFVLLFERQRKAVDYGSKDLQELSDTVVMFRFVNESGGKKTKL